MIEQIAITLIQHFMTRFQQPLLFTRFFTSVGLLHLACCEECQVLSSIRVFYYTRPAELNTRLPNLSAVKMDKPIIGEVRQKILEEVKLPESEIEGTLRLAREKYKTEISASRDYHRSLAQQFGESGDNQIALRQRILAEIYQSTFERA